MIDSAIRIVESGESLSMEQMADAMGHIMEGSANEDAIVRLLVALHRRGETVAEVAGAAKAMRQRMTPIRSDREGLIDTCGTGGDGSKTFNISTAAALVTASAGVPVAKHGNRGITSRSGSADALAALGVNIDAGVACVETCLRELGICFCFAPLLHRAMKHVSAARKRIATPTIFNILGPLANPAAAPFQLMGVGRPELQPLLAEALLLLKAHRVLIVHGSDGLDEVTLAGPTHVIEASPEGLRSFDWTPADFGLPPADRDEILVDGPAQSAEIIQAILDGRRGPPRDIVLANSAAALWTVGRAATLRAGVQLATDAIDAGATRNLLAKLSDLSHQA